MYTKVMEFIQYTFIKMLKWSTTCTNDFVIHVG